MPLLSRCIESAETLGCKCGSVEVLFVQRDLQDPLLMATVSEQLCVCVPLLKRTDNHNGLEFICTQGEGGGGKKREKKWRDGPPSEIPTSYSPPPSLSLPRPPAHTLPLTECQNTALLICSVCLFLSS